MKHIEYIIEGSDGIKLFAQRHEVDRPKAAVVLLHGYCEHSLRYGHVVDRFLAGDLSCYLYDQRGHGRSDGPRAAVRRFEEYLSDLDKVFMDVRDHYPEGPLFLLGHSMGGLAACRYALSRKPVLDGIILSSPFFGLKVRVRAVKLALGRLMSRIWPSLSLAGEIDPHLLTHDEAIVQDYIADPSVSKIANARWFTESTEAQRYCLDHAEEWNWPALVMHGGDDRIADPEATREFFRKMAHPESKLIIHEGMYHEIFNEIDRDQVLDMTTDWIDSKVSER